MSDSTGEADTTDSTQKALITAGLLVGAIVVAVVVAKIVDYCYDHHIAISDDASDISEHTRDLIRMRTTVTAFRKKKGEDKAPIEPISAKQRKIIRLWSAKAKESREIAEQRRAEHQAQHQGARHDLVIRVEEAAGPKVDTLKVDPLPTLTVVSETTRPDGDHDPCPLTPAPPSPRPQLHRALSGLQTSGDPSDTPALVAVTASGNTAALTGRQVKDDPEVKVKDDSKVKGDAQIRDDTHVKSGPQVKDSPKVKDNPQVKDSPKVKDSPRVKDSPKVKVKDNIRIKDGAAVRVGTPAKDVANDNPSSPRPSKVKVTDTPSPPDNGTEGGKARAPTPGSRPSPRRAASPVVSQPARTASRETAPSHPWPGSQDSPVGDGGRDAHSPQRTVHTGDTPAQHTQAERAGGAGDPVATDSTDSPAHPDTRSSPLRGSDSSPPTGSDSPSTDPASPSRKPDSPSTDPASPSRKPDRSRDSNSSESPSPARSKSAVSRRQFTMVQPTNHPAPVEARGASPTRKPESPKKARPKSLGVAAMVVPPKLTTSVALYGRASEDLQVHRSMVARRKATTVPPTQEPKVTNVREAKVTKVTDKQVTQSPQPVAAVTAKKARTKSAKV